MTKDTRKKAIFYDELTTIIERLEDKMKTMLEEASSYIKAAEESGKEPIESTWQYDRAEQLTDNATVLQDMITRFEKM